MQHLLATHLQGGGRCNCIFDSILPHGKRAVVPAEDEDGGASRRPTKCRTCKRFVVVHLEDVDELKKRVEVPNSFEKLQELVGIVSLPGHKSISVSALL